LTEPLANQIPVLPSDASTLVRLNGVVQVLEGGLLAMGRWRRLAAVALVGSIIPITLAGHRFWKATDKTQRSRQRVHFVKNLGLLGGLILAGATGR
jgi:uncharacterized membrane protein YphA (DoxX/SURF4 family)